MSEYRTLIKKLFWPRGTKNGQEIRLVECEADDGKKFHFLQEGDEVIVVVYDNALYCTNPILSFANKGILGEKEGISALVQRVIRA